MAPTRPPLVAGHRVLNLHHAQSPAAELGGQERHRAHGVSPLVAVVEVGGPRRYRRHEQVSAALDAGQRQQRAEDPLHSTRDVVADETHAAIPLDRRLPLPEGIDRLVSGRLQKSDLGREGGKSVRRATRANPLSSLRTAESRVRPCDAVKLLPRSWRFRILARSPGPAGPTPNTLVDTSPTRTSAGARPRSSSPSGWQHPRAARARAGLCRR